MRPNPLLPRTQADETAFPIDMLRIALTGEASGRASATGQRVGQIEAANVIAQAWTSTTPREDRAGVARFYVGVLTSFLTRKSPHTVRSWSGTVCDFFDFVAHERVRRGEPSLRLVAPHDLMQADVDAYVASLGRAREATPEMIVHPQEKMVAEWLYDAFQKAPARAFLEKEIAEGMEAEKLSWRTELPGKIQKGFEGKQTGLTAILSALVRKKVLVRSPTAKEATLQRAGDNRKKYPYDKARYSRPSSVKPSAIATQVQRLTALANFWAKFNDEASLDIQEEFRPRVLRKNPWLKPREELSARMVKPSDDTARSLRRLYPDDLLGLLSVLEKRSKPKEKGVSIRNVLAKRDELAMVFLTGTGLRVFEALQARVENMAPGEGGLWTVSGIKRKLGGDPVTVFVPRLVMEIRDELKQMVYDYAKRASDMIGAEWEEAMAELKAEHPGLDTDELARRADKKIAGFMNLHRKEDFFREQFFAYLALKETGPLLPALGRWGNAMVKARATIDKEHGSAAIVPWDENSIRDRFLLMAPKGSPLRNRLHPHAFRHLSVALAEQATPGAMAAMALAGHKDSRTTDLYRDTVSLRRAATLAIEGRLRDMLSVARGEVPAETAAPAAPPVVPPGVVPPAAQPEAEVVVLAPRAPGQPLGLMPKPAVKEMSVAAELLSQPKVLPAPPERVIRAEDIATPPVVPLPEAPLRPEKIAVVGTLGAQPPPAGTPKAPKPKSPAPKPVSLAATGQEAALWSTTPSEWFLPARSSAGKDPVPVKAEPLSDIFRKGWLPGAPVVSQWKLHPVLSGALVWTGVRTLLPYRIAMNLKVEKEVSWTKESLELTVPTGSKMLSRNAAKAVLPESLISLPLVNFDDQAYLSSLAPMLNVAYDQAAASDPAAAKAMTRWLIELRSHSARFKALVEKKNAALKPSERLSLVWLGASAEVPVSSWGSAEAVGAARSSVVRNHEPSEVIRFLREQGTTMFGPIGRAANVKDLEAYDIAMESRLQSNIDSIEDYQEKTSKTGKVRVTQAPRGLHRYKLPDWVTLTDDPIGDPKHGLSDEDTALLKKWILRAKTARDIVSFDKDSATCTPYWTLAFSFASSQERTIECPDNLQSYRRSFAAKFKVDPVVACRRAIRHLWEVSEAIRGDQPKGSVAMKPEDIDLIWGVVWSWIMPSSEEVKSTIRAALEEAGKDARFVDTDNIRFVTNRWMDVATVESLVAVLDQTFQATMQRVLDDQVKIAAKEKTAAESAREVDSFAKDAAISLVTSLWRTMGSDYDSINEAMVKAMTSFYGKLGRSDVAKFTRMDKKAFDEAMDRMSRPLIESAWSPRNLNELQTKQVRVEYLSRMGLPLEMAVLGHKEYVESLAKFRASTIAMVSVASMAIYKASALREIVAEATNPSASTAPTGEIQSVREAALQAAARGAALSPTQLQMAAASGIEKAGRMADVEEIRSVGMSSSLGLGDIGGSGSGGMSVGTKEDKTAGVVSGAVEKYEMAVFSVLDSEKSKGDSRAKARYDEMVRPYAPKGGTDIELAAQSRAYVSAMRKFLATFGADFELDKRSQAAAARQSVQEAKVAESADPAMAAYEAAVQRVLAEQVAKGPSESKAAHDLYGKVVEPKAGKKGKFYVTAMRKFLAAYNADFEPGLKPNRRLTPNLAQVSSAPLQEPSLRLLPGIRINPIALILALYA